MPANMTEYFNMEVDFLDRYQRQIGLKEVGLDGQRALHSASVLVVGLGGLGCPVVQNLVGAGVGCFILVDPDRVELSNLHRQPLYTKQDLDLFKADVVADYIRSQNEQIKVLVFKDLLSAENAEVLISKVDLVMDCTDNFDARYLINDVCGITQKPWVYGSISKFEGQVAVFNALVSLKCDGTWVSNARADSATVAGLNSAQVRSVNYRDVFPNKPPLGEVENCAQAGVIGVLAAIIGSLQSMEALKLILGSSNLLVNQILTYDALNCRMHTFKVADNTPSNE